MGYHGDYNHFLPEHSSFQGGSGLSEKCLVKSEKMAEIEAIVTLVMDSGSFFVKYLTASASSSHRMVKQSSKLPNS